MTPEVERLREIAARDREACAEVAYAYGVGGYQGGSFRQALILAVQRADMVNRADLAGPFPAIVAAATLIADHHDGVKVVREIISGGQR